MRNELWTALLVVAACGPSEPPEPAPVEPTEVGEAPEAPEAPEPDEPAPESAGTAPASADEATRPTPGTLRFVVVTDGPELLGSEARGLDAIAAGLGEGRELTRETATSDERAWVDAVRRGEPELPSTWATSETVVVVHVGAPRELRSGRRVTGGVRGTYVVRPPARKPLLQEVGGETERMQVDAEHTLPWIGAVIAAARGDER